MERANRTPQRKFSETTMNTILATDLPPYFDDPKNTPLATRGLAVLVTGCAVGIGARNVVVPQWISPCFLEPNDLRCTSNLQSASKHIRNSHHGASISLFQYFFGGWIPVSCQGLKRKQDEHHLSNPVAARQAQPRKLQSGLVG